MESHKKILICYIEHVTIKDSKYKKINSVNSLYLIINKVNGYVEQISEKKIFDASSY